jgi:hypothetical protein
MRMEAMVIARKAKARLVAWPGKGFVSCVENRKLKRVAYL